METSKSLIEQIIAKILSNNSSDAEKLFKDKVFNIHEMTHYAFTMGVFDDFLCNYAKMYFGERDGYIESLDIYKTFDEERHYLQVFVDACESIKRKNYRNAKRDLNAISQGLNLHNLLYEKYIEAYFSFYFSVIAEGESSIGESVNALKIFLKTLNKDHIDRYNDLAVVVFRDFKSLILLKKNGINDGMSVFENELSLSIKSPLKQKIDIDKAINDFNTDINRLIGLENVKEEILTLINLTKINLIKSQRGMKFPNISKHLVFTGNPGTGKTTVARLLSNLYFNLGLLSKGHFIETERSLLVGEYIGHTAPKTKKVIDNAKGGILFIDEAYSLASETKSDFGNEAIETLLKLMEDYRDDLIVIVAGYPDKMDMFLDSNPGLRSRFATKICFEDYNISELIEIFESLARENEYKIEKSAKLKIKEKLLSIMKTENFGNARSVRNIFEEIIKKQANRIAQQKNITNEDLILLKKEDV